jgi:YgiT-type zinc finger domain-containing protein
MNEVCALCGEEGRIETVREKRTFKVRGEDISVAYEALKCNKCGEEFINSKSEDDPLARVYRIYRKRHDMLQPEEGRFNGYL